ncbi:hypothetical protein QQX98_012717 [Neonectria punicea]|uniref:NAD(P)-binding domain-containing protein n=1 Tax=Neonectria punicea TaxID=979145 RepID=A0ABR1GIB5_9HYPO
MAPKVFLTGATGYIGGAALAQLYDAHPDYDFSLFVRNEERGKSIAAKYPGVKFVYGNLDDSAVIEKAAAEADVVVHSADNGPSANAIAKGLAAGHTAEKPGYWIHLSGTGILTWYDFEQRRYGEGPLPEQKYNDLEGIEGILSLSDHAPHRNIDKIVQGANSDAVKTAIVAPPCIYGTGRGTVNTRSLQVPNLARATLRLGYAPIVGAGQTEWDNVHIADLADLFGRLVDASQDAAKRDNPDIFGRNGHFFARQDVHKWSDVATWIAEEVSRRGYLPEPKTKSVTQKEVVATGLVAAPTWGANSKGEAERAKKYLGWDPRAPALKDTISEAVEVEAKALGLTPTA